MVFISVKMTYGNNKNAEHQKCCGKIDNLKFLCSSFQFKSLEVFSISLNKYVFYMRISLLNFLKLDLFVWLQRNGETFNHIEVKHGSKNKNRHMARSSSNHMYEICLPR